MDELLGRITVDDKVLRGKPTIRRLRISVEQLLRARAAGVSEAELLREYPDLEPEDLRAVDAYSAERIGSECVFAISGGTAAT